MSIEIKSNLLEYITSIAYSRSDIDEMLQKNSVKIEIINKLPAKGEKNILYFLVHDNDEADLFIYSNDAFVKVSSEKIDLSQFYTKKEITALLNEKADNILANNEKNGLMSSDDKVKLDNVFPSATKTEYTPSVVKGDRIGVLKINDVETNILAPATDFSDFYSKKEILNLLKLKADNILVTNEKDGLMSSNDKIKLDELVNVDLSNYWTKQEVNSLLDEELSKKANNTLVTNEADGLMSVNDKNKLDKLTTDTVEVKFVLDDGTEKIYNLYGRIKEVEAVETVKE